MTGTGVLALIPARSGSKSVPDKNVRDFAGKPLLVHSIVHALAARRVERVIVSTDSERYAEIARAAGAETPFLRPAEFAADDSTDLDVFRHALDWLDDNEGWTPDILVHLRPTYPLRDPDDIDRIIDILRNDRTLDAVRTVAPAPATPYKMWTRGPDGLLVPVADLGSEAYNQPRQKLPAVYLQNACIDAVRSRVIREQGSMTGRRIHGYVMQHDVDVDSYADLERLRAHAGHRGPDRSFCIDLDSIMTRAGTDAAPRPRPDVVAALNRLYDAGCRVVVHAADEAAASALLNRWQVRCHEVSSARRAADYLVDGRAIGISAFLDIAAAITSAAISNASDSDPP